MRGRAMNGLLSRRITLFRYNAKQFIKTKRHDIGICYQILFKGRLDDLSQTVLNPAQEIEESMGYIMSDDAEDLGMFDNGLTKEALHQEIIDNAVKIRRELESFIVEDL